MQQRILSLIGSFCMLAVLPLQAENSASPKNVDQPSTVTAPGKVKDSELIPDRENFFKADGRKWKIGRDLKSEQSWTTIYILESENMDSPTESLAAHKSELYTQPLENVDQWLPALMRQFLGETLEYKVLNKGPQGFLVEWWVPAKEGQPGKHGWTRAIKTDKGVFMLEYTTTNSDKVEELRKVWVPILENAKAPN